MNIYTSKFTTGQTAVAAGISTATLQNWLKRGVIVGHRKDAPIEGGGSPGHYRAFSFYNVVEIAVAKQISDLGINLEHAFHAAAVFSHTGDEHRFPALPFPRGYTMLCFSPVAASNNAVRVLNWAPGTDIIGELRAQWRPIAHMTLEMDDVFDSVCAALGAHPEAVLEQAYGSDRI